MDRSWSLDLGTTNTVVAACEGGRVTSIALTGLSAPPEEGDHQYGGSIPSVVEVMDPLARRVVVGQEAFDRNLDQPSPAVARSFKRPLGRRPEQCVARYRGAEVSARRVAEALVREILRALRAQERPPGFWHGLQARIGWWPRESAMTAPVDSYDVYARELERIGRRCGVRRVRLIDEPVAAALGYGVDLREPQTVLIVDFGGGTIDYAVVPLGPMEAIRGRGEVLAVLGDAQLGGDTIDGWLVELYCQRTRARPDALERDLVWQARALKHRLGLPEAPEESWGGAPFSRADLIRLLEERSLYETVAQGAWTAIREAEARRGEPLVVHQVLLTGGSSLLPEFPERLEGALGRPVRRWRPFDSVARGAALFAGGYQVDPILYHDYALRVRIANSVPPQYEYERIVRAGTPFPTPAGAETIRHYAAAYDGQDAISLPIVELGRYGWSPLRWELRANNRCYWQPTSETDRERVSVLNEHDPELPLRPPGQPHTPRIRVTFRISANRRLHVSVYDLVARQHLVQDCPMAELR